MNSRSAATSEGEWVSPMGKWLPNAANERVYVLLLVIGGLVMRFAWLALVYKEWGVAGGEAQNIAQSVFRNLSVADAFGRGSGLTAHTNPLLPILAGLLYRLFGWGAVPAEAILLALALACAFGSALLFYDAFRRLGVSRIARLAGLALFCVLPINLRHEMVMFRVWEGALTALILAFGLRHLVIWDGRTEVTFGAKFIFALIAAVGLFINPVAGLTLYAAGAVFLLRNLRLENVLATAALGLLVLAAVLAPWTIRNYLAFERFIPLRSNGGLELALAFHSGVAGPGTDAEIFTRRWQAIHPFATKEAFERMQAGGGEQVYTQELGREARTWMAAHPALTAKLALKHAVQFYFPPSWQSELWGGANRGSGFKSAIVAAITLTALLAAVALAATLGGAWLYPFIFIVVPAIPYAFVQPTDRYHYLISTLAIFLAVSASRLLSLRREKGSGTATAARPA